MPNGNATCGCGMVVDLPKSPNGSQATRKRLIGMPKAKGGKLEGRSSKKQQDEGRSKTRTSETGSSSSRITDQSRPNARNSNHEKRLNHSRRTRSADRAESHYTYIDSGSSIFGGRIPEDEIPEAIYDIIPDLPMISGNEIGNNQSGVYGRSQVYHAIPSMVSPPPTYDAAIAKTWQSGLPPSYEEYLCHKYAMIPRSHTPPPPWSDSMTTDTTTGTSVTTATTTTSNARTRREMLASQPEIREYLAQLTLAQNNERAAHYQHHQGAVLREQQVRGQQRARAMPPRSQSESRAQQQRIATMYEDAGFCMEPTVLQSALEHGIALCSLM